MATIGPVGSRKRTGVSNKQPAPVQITAEQILREAVERQEEAIKPPRQEITNKEELAEFQLDQRKMYENAIRRDRYSISNWLKYAKFEEKQRDLARTRSVYERAMDVDHRNPRIWLHYAEFEMRNKNVNHARNIWDRAVTMMPRQNTFWFRYVFMEQMLENYPGVRQLFERWMQWQPEEAAWNAYIKFELKHGEVDRAREVYKRYVLVHPRPGIWIKWARFEEKLGNLAGGREVYEQAIDYLEDESGEKLYLAFAAFEERQKEFERARAIYRYALDHIPRHAAQELYTRYIAFEKQYGDKEGIEEAIRNKRRLQYEAELKESPHNYDIWFDYARLEETAGQRTAVEEVYERAIAQIPPVAQKRYWQRYIYLWINYAVYEELSAGDVDKARAVYGACLKVVPHEQFTFGFLWVLAAQFEVRQRDLQAARRILGRAIGLCPRKKVFAAYLDLERKLGNIDRCRTLYQKQLELFPADCTAWVEFARLEHSLREVARVRAIFELAVEQPLLDMPEIVWKAYIDFELAEEEHERVRGLYDRLLDRTKHVKVYISYAQFEHSIGHVTNARVVMKKANEEFKDAQLNEERAELVRAWLELENEVGEEEHIAHIKGLQPERVKKRRKIETEDGMDAGMEEYYDFIFPDQKQALPNLKLLQRAKMWKKKNQATGE